MNDRLTKKDLNEIEIKLSKLTYKQIPKEFIRIINQEFSSIAYLKSLLEMKQESNE